MAEIKFHDFVELDYTGKTKEEGILFDTTLKDVAEKNGLDTKQGSFKPIIICVGEKHLVPGVDKQLVGKEVGKEYTFDLNAEDAFGKKDVKMIQLIPTAKFRKDGFLPQPGMQVNIDNTMGIVKTVSGGRTLVDFNHPLAGKEVIYTVKVSRVLDNEEEKVKNLLKIQMGIAEPHIHVTDGNVEVTFGKNGIPQEIAAILEGKVKAVIPSVKSVKFVPAEGHKHADAKTAEHTHEHAHDDNTNHDHGHNHNDHTGHNHQH